MKWIESRKPGYPEKTPTTSTRRNTPNPGNDPSDFEIAALDERKRTLHSLKFVSPTPFSIGFSIERKLGDVVRHE